MTAAAGFLRDLFGDPFPAGLRAAVWQKDGKRSHYLDEPAAASQFQDMPDVYVSVSLVDRSTSNPRLRAKARDARCIGGFWLDVDMPGPADPPTKRPAPDHETAAWLIRCVAEPTIVVHSGHGLQAYWLLEEPWVFGSDGEHEQAQRIAHGWEILHRTRALARGFTIDSVHDLARVMRLPGTRNLKEPGNPVPVTVLHDDGPRHTLETLSRHALLHAPVTSRPRPETFQDDRIDGEFPTEKHNMLLQLDDTYRRTFNRDRRDKQSDGWSPSHYDLALASIAAARGWTDEQIAALIRRHRLHHDPADEKAGRADYLARTVAKARTGTQREERAQLQDDALEELAAMSEQSGNGGLDRDRAMALFNGAIGAGLEDAPVIKELIQYSDDPDQARFVFVLSDGREVNVGQYTNLRQPRRLDERLGPSTGFVMETVKDNDVWRGALRTILKCRSLREEPEEQIVEWVKRYVEDNLTTNRDEAARAGAPFEHDGRVYIRPEQLALFVRTVMRERVGSPADLKPLLRKAGFEQQKMHYRRESGRRSTTNYWWIPREEIT